MTTKKIIVIIGVVVVSIGVLIALFVGGIVGIALYSVGHSEAASTAKDFLQKNERLKQDIGTVTDFGSIVTGNISINNGNGGANLNLKVIGENKTVNASVELMTQTGGEWRVVAASYRDESGRTVDLLSAYDARLSPTLTGFLPVELFIQ